MELNKDDIQQSHQGTGSAENTGENRNEQVNNKTDFSEREKQNIAGEIGENPDAVASIKDMGMLSGRDDSSGGTGDRMEDQSTGQGTDR